MHYEQPNIISERTTMSGLKSESESECKCLTCNQKPTGLVYCTSQTKRLMEKN